MNKTANILTKILNSVIFLSLPICILIWFTKIYLNSLPNFVSFSEKGENNYTGFFTFLFVVQFGSALFTIITGLCIMLNNDSGSFNTQFSNMLIRIGTSLYNIFLGFTPLLLCLMGNWGYITAAALLSLGHVAWKILATVSSLDGTFDEDEPSGVFWCVHRYLKNRIQFKNTIKYRLNIYNNFLQKANF